MHRARDHARLPMLAGQPGVGLIKEVVSKASRMQKQHARRDIPLGWAELRVPGGIKALNHLQLANLGSVSSGWCIEIEPALFNQLQAGSGSDRFRHREEPEDAVGRHVRIAAQHALSGCARVDIATSICCNRDDAGHAISGADGAIEDCIGNSLEIATQENLPSKHGFVVGAGRPTAAAPRKLAPARPSFWNTGQMLAPNNIPSHFAC